jgi:hypothetical protein
VFRNESGFYHSFVSLELSPAGISNASVTPLYRKGGVCSESAFSRGWPDGSAQLTVWTGASWDRTLEVGEYRRATESDGGRGGATRAGRRLPVSPPTVELRLGDICEFASSSRALADSRTACGSRRRAPTW